VLNNKRQPKPKWLKAQIPAGEDYFRIKKSLEKKNLSTICQQARCPNISECWNNYHATFLIMGDTCSRDCKFCSVKPGKPIPLLEEEPERVLEMVDIMKAKYVVITSVTRDDLEDGGSSHFARVITHLKTQRPQVKIEVLIPDFRGSTEHLDIVLNAGPDVLAKAGELGTDLLVMGAWGHTRLREFVLGGATDTALRESRIPVLMSH